MNLRPAVEIGQVYHSRDKRESTRYLRVESIDDFHHAMCEPVAKRLSGSENTYFESFTNRRTSIRTSRLRSCAFELVV